nr:hypothetical protein [Candidatus Freyarchaeota archaeon]
MLKILDNESDIKKAQQTFEKRFKQFIDEKISVNIGFKGGSIKKEVSWASKLGIWVLFQLLSNRYGNAFGIGKPREGSNVPITCEINFPLSGINRTIGGAFAKDSSGNIFVIHSGKIQGGRKGIGKSLFEEKYRGERIVVDEGMVENDFALLGALNSSRFARQVSQFVYEVDRIKRLVSFSSPQIETLPKDYGFSEEFTGKKQYRIGKAIEAECDHGLIVNNLASTLESLGFNVGNDRALDLYIINTKGEITTIFEIKTDTSTSSLYSGVGQLLLNSINLAKRPRLILTIPEKLSIDCEGKLNKLRIELLKFSWSEDKAVFPGLESLRL